MQDVDRILHVETLPTPACHGCSRIDDDFVLVVVGAYRANGIAGQVASGGNLGQDASVGVSKPKLAIGLAIDLKALFVDGSVVSAAEQGKIRQCRGPALRPVMDVMALDESQTAAREATAPVSVSERAA